MKEPAAGLILALLILCTPLSGCIQVHTNTPTQSPADSPDSGPRSNTSTHTTDTQTQNDEATNSNRSPDPPPSAPAPNRSPRLPGPNDPGPIKATDTQLWPDPQTDSHPAYNYATVSTIPTDHPRLPATWHPIDPANASLDDVTLELVGQDPDNAVTYGTGIAIFGELVLVPGRTDGATWILNIEDPQNPEILSSFPAPGRDADTIAFPDGRLFAVFAADSDEVAIWNLTNPHNPSLAATLTPERGSHNVAIVPGTPLLYNAASLGGGLGSHTSGTGAEGTAIYDLSNPQNPTLVQDFANGYSCHDITFSIRDHMNEYRAYCAGIEMTQIWNITDPTQPSVLANVPAFHGNENLPPTTISPASLSHYAGASRDGDTLIVGDETGGGAAPACDAHASQGPVTATGPAGNLYFYDATDESNPTLEGMISPNVPVGTSCTAHFGRLIPAQDRDVIAMAFYDQGVNVIDFTNPANARILDAWSGGGSVWDVWYYQGYLVTGDISRGMDILRVSS